MRDDQLSPSHADTSPPGRVIGGRYRLDRTIGKGGMGFVWSGTDELLDRPVAVKELHLPADVPERDAADLRERALREARAMATLSHPNTVMLYDVVRQDASPFVVMELVAGKSLSAILKKHRALNHYQLAVMVDGVAAALEAAHQVGIVHRDVKPGNVLLGPRGQVKLADFGLSRNVAETTMTRSEVLLGTPAYLPPEIARGGALDSFADLWSLGATLYSASEGRPPYDKTNDPLVTISAIVHGPLPRHHQTGPVGEVLGGLLVKEPERRMPLAEVRRRLHEIVREAGEEPFEPLLNPRTPQATDRIRAPRPAPSVIPRQSSPRPAELRQSIPRVTPTPPSTPRQGATRAQPWIPQQQMRAQPESASEADPPAHAVATEPETRRGRRRNTIIASAVTVAVAGATAFGFLIGRGASAPQPQGADDRDRAVMEGELAHPLQQVRTDVDGGTAFMRLHAGDAVRFSRVAFGDRPATGVSARVRTSLPPSARVKLTVQLKDPGPRGEKLAEIEVSSNTGWMTVPVGLARPISGTGDVFLVASAASGGEALQLDWVAFRR